MNNADHDVFLYLLIDNGMLHGLSASYSEVDSENRPSWLAPIYADHALAVSPFLVDVEAAYEAGDIDRVMGFLNASRPGLHVSIIETGLDLEQIARHLRRFILSSTRTASSSRSGMPIARCSPAVVPPDRRAMGNHEGTDHTLGHS